MIRSFAALSTVAAFTTRGVASRSAGLSVNHAFNRALMVRGGSEKAMSTDVTYTTLDQPAPGSRTYDKSTCYAEHVFCVAHLYMFSPYIYSFPLCLPSA